MLSTGPLRDIIKLSLITGYVKNERSVSVLIVAKPESGKTATLMEFSCNHGVVFVSDLTYTGLVEMLYKFKTGEYKTMLIPDMLKIFGRKLDTSKNFMTLLNEFIEEGIVNIQTFANRVSFDVPVRGNVVAAITSTDFLGQSAWWIKVGFLSRVIPFSYSYSVEAVNNIFDEIMKEGIGIDYQKIDKARSMIVSISRQHCGRIRAAITSTLVYKFKSVSSEDVYGFRIQKNLQTLAKASALASGRDRVSNKDISRIIKLSNWMNYDCRHLV